MEKTEIERASSVKKRVLVVAIAIFTAALHFVTGSQYQGPMPVFVNGYMMDILLPMTFYFLLCLPDVTLLQSWIVKGGLVFLAASSAELLQKAGISFLGSTYDPWDFVMYGLGAFSAVVLDMVIFPRLFSFWGR